MRVILMESNSGLGVAIGAKIVIGGDMFEVSGLNFDFGDSKGIFRAELSECDPGVANSMLFTEDGLTLTGAVHKYMHEMLPGVSPLSEAHAERVAGRLAARLQVHIDCAQANGRLDVKILRAAEKRADEQRETIEKQRNTIAGLTASMRKSDRSMGRAGNLIQALKAENKRLREEINNPSSPTRQNCRCYIDPASASGITMFGEIGLSSGARGSKSAGIAAIISEIIANSGPIHVRMSCADLPDDPWVKDGRSMVTSDTQGSDTRPYAVLCTVCGQVRDEALPFCPRCGSIMRACVNCGHRIKIGENAGVCDQKECREGSKWTPM
jgi:hypothetical protein